MGNAPASNQNSFWFGFDGGDLDIYHLPVTQDGWSDYTKASAGSNPYYSTQSLGQHTYRIYVREAGTKLRSIKITSGNAYFGTLPNAAPASNSNELLELQSSNNLEESGSMSAEAAFGLGVLSTIAIIAMAYEMYKCHSEKKSPTTKGYQDISVEDTEANILNIEQTPI